MKMFGNHHTYSKVTFEYSNEEFEEFLKHECKFKNPDGSYKYTGAIGGLYGFSMANTSIGTLVSATCGCGYRQDVSGDI